MSKSILQVNAFIVFKTLVSVMCYAQISQTEYINYLPLTTPKILSQTEASDYFDLYGNDPDSVFIDEQLIDGIDDYRYNRLKTLCRMFSPILVKNTPYSFPLDLGALLWENKTVLTYDSWELSPATRIFKREAIDVSLTVNEFAGLAKNPHLFDNVNEKLKNWIDEFDPYKKSNSIINLDNDYFKVIYFDFPGQDETSWKDHFYNPISKNVNHKYRESSKVYAHLFIHKMFDRETNERGFEFVIQYWFFYPFNDGGNNHEGDWEHINVVITTKNRQKKVLLENDVWSILRSKGLSIQDKELVIKRVEYYFHHYMMVLDYMTPYAYASSDSQYWEEFNKTLKYKIGEGYLRTLIRDRAIVTVDNSTSLITSPIVYIGGDNQGLDQLLKMPGNKNQDSHGSYPFPGIFRKVGPIGATEKINGQIKYKNILKDEKNVLLPHQYEIEITPDWERIYDRYFVDRSDSLKAKEARRKWYWLILPVRWGYPAVESPAAGIVGNADTGNLAPFGPAFNSAWNRTGKTQSYTLYEPSSYPDYAKLGIIEGFSNRLGWLNFTRLLNLVPPISIVNYWGKVSSKPTIIFDPGRRVVSRTLGIGFHIEHVPKKNLSKFLSLQDKPGLEHFSLYEVNDNYGLGSQWNLHFGRRFSNEMVFQVYGANLKFIDRNTGSMDAKGNLWNITFLSNFRFNLLTEKLQPFLKVGYGWNKHSAEIERPELDHVFVGIPLDRGFRLTPNVLSFGLGFEVLLHESYQSLDFSLQLEYIVDKHFDLPAGDSAILSYFKFSLFTGF